MILSHINELLNIVEAGRQKISNVSPSVWAEERRVMPLDSAFPGPFRFDITPYLREPLDLFSPDSPARIVAVMKGGQIGFSAGVIENVIGWIISENPGPIMYLSGHETLSEEAMNTRIDAMIESCNLRHLIRPSVKKKKNQRTGDTAKSKEFPGGSLVAGASSNHGLLRQRSIRFGLYDDFENAPRATKESGSTERMILHRHAAFRDKMKVAFISTPERKSTSNIEPLFLKGDQRRYKVPCPLCGTFIPLMWSVDVAGTEGTKKGGITWRLDDKNRLIDGELIGDENSVGYICQECGGFFDESHKYTMNLQGFWEPTAEPSEVGYYSYHISCLYAPPGMSTWTDYVRQYLEANPPGQPRNEGLHQTFMNLVLAETYEPEVSELNANRLQQHNIRKYQVGVVPDQLSEADGNGKIILLTCACDLNGVPDDARLDYEIVAWSEAGPSYSVMHGSIGTFIPNQKQKKKSEDRERWVYHHGRPKSVWPELSKILTAQYETQSGRKLRILMAGIDCGHYSEHAYPYIDKLANPFRVALKGRDESKATKFGVDIPPFKPARERANMYLIEVNVVKDTLSSYMQLNWDVSEDVLQPANFMNFPIPSDEMYLYANYFSHFEAEQRVSEMKEGNTVAWRWKKKNSAVQNHMFDCRIYNMTLRDIFVSIMCKEMKIDKPTWTNLVNAILGKK